MKDFKRILKEASKKLKSLYIIAGEEQYILNSFKKQFIEKLVPAASKDFNLTIINEDDNFAANLIKQANLFPVMAQKRFIIAHCYKFFTSKTDKDEKIIELFQNFPSTTVLLIILEGKIDNRIKIVLEAKKIGEIANFASPEVKEINKWIIKKFKQADKIIETRGIDLLKQNFNNQLQRLDSEIEKIITYKYEQELIKLEDVKEVISKDRLLKDTVIFSFVDALSENNKGKALNLLNQMIEAGEQILVILAMITRQLRLLLSVKVLKNKGKNPQIIARMLGEHPYPIKKCYQQCNNFTEEELEIIMEKFLQANLEVVTGKYEDSKMALELALLKERDYILIK